MLFTRRDLVKITLPLIIQQVLTVTIGMIDSMMVSGIGEAAVSGVSLIGSLDVLLIIAFSSMVTGGTVVVSQFLGRGDTKRVNTSAKQVIYVSTGIALLVTTLVLIFRMPLLHLLYGDVEQEVMYHAQRYFFFMNLSFPFLALESAGAALFRAMGNSTVSMLISITINLLNVGGNAILIYGFKMGAAGAAIATLFSRIVGGVVAIVLLHNKKHPIYLEKLWQIKLDFPVIKRILQIGIPSGIESSMFQFGKLLTQSLISTMPTVSIAANAVANTLANYQYMPGTAIGQATVTIVGRCIGAKEKEQAKKYSRILLLCTYGCLWLVVLGTVLFAEPLIGLFHLSAESTATAKTLILYHGVVGAAIWPLGFYLPNVFRSASDVKFSLYVSIFSMWVFRVALSYVFANESVSLFGLTIPGLNMGVLGVWVAMTVDWVFRGGLFLWRYLSGRWMFKYKED